jgi:chemotaxis response regulator CheB
MSILIVSANPLFKEIITAAVGRFQTELNELNPGEALTGIGELRPDVIIIDETIKPASFKELLAEAHCLEKTHIIVLNTVHNEIVLLDSRRATLNTVDDLIDVIASFECENHSRTDEPNSADANLTVRKQEGKPLSE